MKRFNLVVDDDIVTITYGLITTDEKTIPIKEIDNFDISNSILLGLFNLRKVSLKANSVNIGIGDVSDVEFYLNNETSYLLKDRLMNKRSNLIPNS